MSENPPIADDYNDISARLREIEASKRHEAPAEATNTQKWAIWYTEMSTWIHVRGQFNWTPASKADPATLYTTQQEAQEVIDQEYEALREKCEAREYPEQ